MRSLVIAAVPWFIPHAISSENKVCLCCEIICHTLVVCFDVVRPLLSIFTGGTGTSTFA